MLGDQGEQIERARLAVVEGPRDAAAASEDELDAFVRQRRSEQCNLVLGGFGETL